MIESRKCTVPTHACSALAVMQELRREGQLCDVVLRVGRQSFAGHRVVLAGCSPYLRAMFTSGMLESQRHTVEIHGLEETTMAALLDFMYTSSVEITVDNVQGLMQGASLLGLSALRRLCSQFLELQLTPSNCLGIQRFADMFSCGELESSSRHYIYRNFLEVVRSEEFFELSLERLLSLLQCDKLQVMSEEQVFEAACSWLSWDPLTRADKACLVLSAVRLPLVAVAYLEEVVLKSEFFKTCGGCQLQIAKVLRVQHEEAEQVLVPPRAQPPTIMVLGGRNTTSCQLSQVEVYDVLTDTWKLATSMNEARTAVGAATLEGRLYSIGGECALINTQDDTQYLRSAEAYDPVRKIWDNIPVMQLCRSFVAVVSVSGFLYAIGGEDKTHSFWAVERYDPDAKQWAFVSSMWRKRSGAGATVCEGKIYVAGGYDKELHCDRASVECYDPETDEWTLATEMEKARSGLALTTLDQKIYAFGGRLRHTDVYFNLVESYNTLTKQWTTLTPMMTPRAWPAAVVFDNRIYVMGGFDGHQRLSTVECYDPDSNTWTPCAPMTINRAGCGAAVV